MSQARRFFFPCTDEAVDRMTELFDFVWPAVSAFVFARSKAYRHRNLSGTQQRAALSKAFQSQRNLRTEYRSITGLKRANLSKAFIDSSWGDHEQVFARLVLVNIFAIYEGWLDDLLDDFEPNPRTQAQNAWRKKFINACQFHYANNQHQDWAWAMGELQARHSTSLDACFGASLKRKRQYLPQNALSLLRCYRYFKELRNAVVHRNGKASAGLMTAASDYQQVINRNSLGTSNNPPDGTIVPLTLGGEVKLSLFGVVGFNDVVLHLMATLDVEAGLTTSGEAAMVRFFRGRVNQRSVSGHRDATARRMANEYGLVGLKQPGTFVQILTNHGFSMP